MSAWRRYVGDRPIVTRLVLAVAGAMAVVLLASGLFVFWRVQYALDRQLDQDLKAYQEVVERDVAGGTPAPVDTPGQTYQVYDSRGRVIDGNAASQLVDQLTISLTAAGTDQSADFGSFIPAAEHPYRVATVRVQTPDGQYVVVATAISRFKHDEALRELLVQLGLSALVTLAAAALVGYRTAKAALNPVERYRLAAENADVESTLPVTPGRDDEITRLGHTFNALLGRIRKYNDRERQFLADASHELRSPLALMRTELEWALMRPRDEAEIKTAFESLRGQVDRLITISNALLDLEELRSSEALTKDAVDLDLLIEDIVGRFTPQATSEGRSIEFAVEPRATMTGNQQWLELAIGNLLANALRYGQGTIRVTVTQAAGRTLIAVDDDGPGFPVEFIGKAFDRFTRADTSRATRGSGLGLALVQAVAEGHGGTASVAGAQVTLDLATH